MLSLCSVGSQEDVHVPYEGNKYVHTVVWSRPYGVHVHEGSLFITGPITHAWNCSGEGE